MKKLLALLICGLLVAGLAACGNGASDGGGKNGTYTAEMSDDFAANDGHGYKDTLTVTYQDGAITSADFDSIEVDTGAKKSDFTAEEYPMDPPVSQWLPELNAQIVSAGDSNGIDGVAGATNASDSARKLLEAIEKDGVEGGTIVVDG